MNSSVNLEEAANIASEFIYSLDNLPHEVSHILQEIKVKETRAQVELQQDIDKDTAKYIRHAVRASSSVPSSPSSRAPSPKSSSLPAKIETAYSEINQLSSEKLSLAQTLIDLITRTRARLDSDLAKVRILQGETVDYASVLGSSLSVLPGLGISGLSDRNSVAQVNDSIRNALTSTPTIPDLRQTGISNGSASLNSASIGPAQKKRRLQASSIKLTSTTPTKHRSASPTTTAPLTSTHQRAASRLSRQTIMRQETDMDEGEEDAEGEDGEGDDDRVYCFCQKQSYGDMIACDNEGGCPFEWFHLSCVGMKQPTPEKWYCSVCRPTMSNTKKGTGPPAGRKGRKK